MFGSTLNWGMSSSSSSSDVEGVDGVIFFGGTVDAGTPGLIFRGVAGFPESVGIVVDGVPESTGVVLPESLVGDLDKLVDGLKAVVSVDPYPIGRLM